MPHDLKAYSDTREMENKKERKKKTQGSFLLFFSFMSHQQTMVCAMERIAVTFGADLFWIIFQ
jgi:hypothetical protein